MRNLQFVKNIQYYKNSPKPCSWYQIFPFSAIPKEAGLQLEQLNCQDAPGSSNLLLALSPKPTETLLPMFQTLNFLFRIPEASMCNMSQAETGQ